VSYLHIPAPDPARKPAAPRWIVRLANCPGDDDRVAVPTGILLLRWGVDGEQALGGTGSHQDRGVAI
jgi:hypothetical protein